MSPHGYPKSAARPQDSTYLNYGVWRGAPNPAEAGYDVEDLVIPREIMHITNPDIGLRAAVLGYRHQSW
jgi:hypothetical protein